jgi:hypothetical protein
MTINPIKSRIIRRKLGKEHAEETRRRRAAVVFTNVEAKKKNRLTWLSNSGEK